jgi:hypothetical protein
MVLIPVLCPHCQSDQVIKGGTTKAGKQRYRCQNVDCSHYSFVLNPAYKAHLPEAVVLVGRCGARCLSVRFTTPPVATGRVGQAIPLLHGVPLAPLRTQHASRIGRQRVTQLGTFPTTLPQTARLQSIDGSLRLPLIQNGA